MSAREQLRVRVNDELVLDAGTCEEVCGPHGPQRLIRPPETTLFHQVLDYLKAKPDPPQRPSCSMVGREGVAAAAVAVRWGSYLAALLDHDKPIWPEVQSPGTSRISDEEMARINIEASAALAEWIDLHRADRGEPLYEQLVNRAVAYMPMPKKTSKLTVTEFGALAQPEMAARIVGVADAARLERVRGDVERHPSRVLANALLNTAWRNGPVENIHAGALRACPLDQRRVTPAEERELMVEGDLVETPARALEEVQDCKLDHITRRAVAVDDDVVTNLLGFNIGRGIAPRQTEDVGFGVKRVLNVRLHRVAHRCPPRTGRLSKYGGRRASVRRRIPPLTRGRSSVSCSGASGGAGSAAGRDRRRAESADGDAKTDRL